MPGTQATQSRENESKQRQEPPHADAAFLSHGLRIGIRLESAPELASRLEFMPPGAVRIPPTNLDRLYDIVALDADTSPAGRSGLHILADGEHLEWPIVYDTAEQALTGLEDQVERYVAEFSVEHLFIHAGVVVWGHSAIVIPGRSYAGKSTLTKGLVNAGGVYYSDEFAVLDRDGLVHPYRRKLSLRDGPYGAAGRIDMTGGTSETLPPVPVGLVALVKYDAAQGWNVDQLTGAAAIMAICDHTVAIRRRPADTFAFLGAVEREATVITGTRGEADDTIERLLTHIHG